MRFSGIARWRALLFCGIAALSAACGEGWDGTAGAPRFAVGGRELALRLVPVRDTVAVGDPVLVLQFLYNPAQDREVLYGPGMVDIAVTGPDGRTLPRWKNPPLLHGERPGKWTTLPPNGVVGDVSDLTCGFPVNALEPSVEARGCTWKYDFTQPGEYRLVGYYGTVAEPMDRIPRVGIDYLTLRSDTAVIVVRPR